MKIMQIMLFLMCLNAAIFLLGTTGLYFTDVTSEYDIEAEWTGGDMLLVFVAEFITATSVGVVLARYGVNPFHTAAYLVFFGTFVALYSGFVKVLTTFGTIMGPGKVVMDSFLLILTMVVAALIMYTAIQMATGGAKSYE